MIRGQHSLASPIAARNSSDRRQGCLGHWQAGPASTLQSLAAAVALLQRLPAMHQLLDAEPSS